MLLDGGITVFMALVDFIPVIMFFVAGIILIKDLSNKLSKGFFALLSSGIVMVFIAGFLKALWKILFAIGLCDYVLLDNSFFPMQSIGFVLVFIGILSLLVKRKTVNSLFLTVPVYESSMPFVVVQVLGCSGVQWSLFAISRKMKRPLAGILFVVSFVCMLGMGYLSSKFDDSSNMHWIAQLVNTVSQAALLSGVIILDKNGLKEARVI